jgi:hypothetical protein
MAHELTHALDDQHYDIDGTLKKLGEDTDATLAFQAVVEGSGTNLMNQWFKGHLSEVSAEDLQRAQETTGNSLEDAPPYLWLPLLAVYLRGEGFLVHTGGLNLLMKAADVKDVDRAFQSPPRSSEQILHPDKYWKDSKRDDPLHVTIDTSRLPSGWKVAGQDTLGELYLGLLTTPQADRKGLSANPLAVMSVKYTNKASEGWGGDRLVLLSNGDDRFLELVTAWDTQKDADEFADALDKKPGVIPLVDAKQGSGSAFHAGATATDVEVVQPATAEGTPPVVVVRITSFSKPMDASKLELPWHVEPKLAAQSK